MRKNLTNSLFLCLLLLTACAADRPHVGQLFTGAAVSGRAEISVVRVICGEKKTSALRCHTAKHS